MKKKMERNNKTSISIIIFVLIFIGVTNMNASGFFGIGESASWKEEILLHDGSKIIVERWQTRGGRHELGQKPGIKEQSITFTLPGTKKTIKWTDEYSKDIGHSNFNLLALHILNNALYIVVSTYGCLAYNKWGRPNPPYVIFKFENNGWKRIELSELPTEFENINLVINSSAHEEKLVSEGLASAEMVRKFNSSLRQEAYKTIIRTPLKPGSLGVSCPELVRVKGGWRSPDGAKAPIPILPSGSKEKK